MLSSKSLETSDMRMCLKLLDDGRFNIIPLGGFIVEIAEANVKFAVYLRFGRSNEWGVTRL